MVFYRNNLINYMCSSISKGGSLLEVLLIQLLLNLDILLVHLRIKYHRILSSSSSDVVEVQGDCHQALGSELSQLLGVLLLLLQLVLKLIALMYEGWFKLSELGIHIKGLGLWLLLLL